MARRPAGADPERRARMERYCEARRAELIEMGYLPAELVGLGAGRLSELVIACQARGPVALSAHHPSRSRRRG